VDPLQEIYNLNDCGLFADALAALDRLKGDVSRRQTVQIVRAELLERVGRSREAKAIVHRALASRNLGARDRTVCDFVLARAAIDDGDFDSAIAYLNKSIAMAQSTGDLERACSAQLKLLVVLSDGVGADATGALLAEARANAIKTGNPRLLAAVHVYFAQIEASRGSVQSAGRHLRQASQLLRDAPNYWLESMKENINLALSLMASEFDAAQVHARNGRKLAERTGGALEYAVNQGNSGLLWHFLGRLDEAAECYERTIPLFVRGSQNHSGAIESLARVRLAQHRFDDCEALLSLIEEAPLTPRSRSTYVYRHSLLTRAQLWIRRSETAKAIRVIEQALRLAEEADDLLLKVSALLVKVELLLVRPELEKVGKVLDRINTHLQGQSADVYAQYERALGHVAAAAGNLAVSQDHVDRARRIYSGLHHIQGLTELQQPPPVPTADSTSLYDGPGNAASTLHSSVAILSNAKHPEFVARELVAILASSSAALRAAAISRTAQGKREILVEIDRTNGTDVPGLQRHFVVAKTADRSIEVVVEPKDDLESAAIIDSAARLASQARELKVARDERNDRATIWPVRELPPSANDPVISGHMSDNMNFAQRVAQTKVTVLITGESGTGKEILARAIHDFSNRAQRPFVPFNCAAIPRELLESQLFGYRRGAFTGADRDQLGLIRSAAGGTLFLDEVGEMSLDLQPKLLRFLDYGEIAPLGEPSPLNVDVRIVAATNTNLLNAVRDGKFREDLFYRLNVVNLPIKPLRERRDEIPAMITRFVAQAAREYNKGYLEVAEETLERLLLFRWPGNVRQLQNEIRRMVALAEPNSTLEPDSISADIVAAMPDLRHPTVNGREIAIPLRDKLGPTLARVECEMIKAALRDHHGRLEPAARSLGISRKGLYLKRQRLGL